MSKSDSQTTHGPSTYFAVPLAKNSSSSVTSVSLSSVFRKSATNLTAHQRHKHFMSSYLYHYQNPTETSAALKSRLTAPDILAKTELDVLKEHHRFLRNPEDDQDAGWEARIAKKYYDKLFKEYCLANLARYKEGKVAMRWRTQKEVVDGKGQFVCGNLECNSQENLRSWEVNFAYMEAGEKKNALVKLRLCEECSVKLNYRKIKEMRKKRRREEREERRRKKRRSKRRKEGAESESGEEEEDDDRKGRKRKRRRRGDDASDNGEESASGDDEAEDEKDEETQMREEAARIWREPIKEEKEKSRDEEIDDYFAELFK
ncbi:hypothetical protein HK104_005436 [Borealophlyctis nickersoniae]|nr:hypothetical protein HK104_005436 [Borealophlyctis nickersoniae]